jgi:CD109 antigen
MGVAAVASGGGGGGIAPLVTLGASSSDTTGSSSQTAWLLGTLSVSTSANGTAAFAVSIPAGNVQWEGAPLLLHASVTESATGESQNGTARLPVASAPLTATLVADEQFKPGMPWNVTLTLARPDGTPATALDAPAAALTASAARRSGTSALQHTTPAVLDAVGGASASFIIPVDDPACCVRGTVFIFAEPASTSCCVDSVTVSLTGVPSVSAFAVAAPVLGASGQFVSIGALNPDGPLSGGDAVSFTPSATDPAAALRWALMGPQGAAASGSGLPGRTLTLTVPPSAGPSPALLVWYAWNGTVVLDVTTLTVVASLPQSLSASFGTSAAQPGDTVQASATGTPACRVFFAAVDTSVALLGADAALNASGVLQAAAAAAADALSAATAAAAASGAAQEPYCWSPPPQQAAGVALLTSMSVPQCSVVMQMAADNLAGLAVGAAPGLLGTAIAQKPVSPSTGASFAEEPRVRSFFPETWIWTTADADSNGVATTNATAPDTLTSWQLSAFSVHSSLGVAVSPPPRALVVWQPFYITVAAPQTLVRGEHVVLAVGIFSNLSAPTTATVTLIDASASGFDLDGGASATASLAAGEFSAGVSFGITPRSLGTLTFLLRAGAAGHEVSVFDSLQASILVVAEGVPAEVTANALLRVGAAAGDANSSSALLSAPLPGDAVAGSARATLSVVGDLMGQTLAGLGQLLTVPSGCGEQNMIGMAPNVAVLAYLAATPAAAVAAQRWVAAATSNAAVGFQRELTYRHADGSFSAFGESDASGSTWLTAFVLQVFSAASPFVTLDSTVLASAAAWLVGTQDSASGAFASVGNVIHTDMVGGATSKVSLTAFVLAALLQAPPSANVPRSALRAAGAYLAATAAAPGDVYALQLRAYALALSCAAPGAAFCTAASSAVAAVDISAVSPSGGLQHWVGAAAATPMYAWQAPSADIELTGYAVLTLILRGRVADAAEPARWLVAQRNSGGGFASTQDTVVGLAALARFAAATYESAPQLSLSVSAPGLSAGEIAVTPATATLLQQMDVPVGAPVTLSASGSGTVLVQLTTRYNVIPSGGGGGAGAGFHLQLSAVNVSNGAPGVRRLLDATPSALLHQTVCATRLPGAPAARQTGMVVLEAGLFSGYSPTGASLAAVQAAAPGLVKRVDADIPGRRVLFYLDSLPSGGGEPLCISFDSLQTAELSGLSPANSRVYSYYAPGDGETAALPASAVNNSATRPHESVITGPASLLQTDAVPAGAPAVPSAAPRNGVTFWAVAAGAAAFFY